MDERIRLGISACLLGKEVRYDGGHKLDRYLRDTVGRSVQWVPVCPEVECGLPVPREPMVLVDTPHGPVLVTQGSGIDCTLLLKEWASRRLGELEELSLCGFVFKSRSPSCGLNIEVYDMNGSPAGTGRGIFARAFTEKFPSVPVVEDETLHDPGQRKEFFESALNHYAEMFKRQYVRRDEVLSMILYDPLS